MEILIEVKRFLKNNIKKALLISFLAFLIIIGLLFMLDLFFGSRNSYDSTEDQVYTHQFDFYIENQDGTLFSNPSIIIENIIMTETHKQIEDEYNVSLIVENEEIDVDTNIDEIDEEDIEYKFRLDRDSNSGRYTFVLALEDINKSENIIQEFYSIFENNELGVIENKNVVMFTEPYLIEPESENINQTNNNSYFRMRNIILGAILSVALGIVFIIISEMISKTINYYFSYDADKYEHFVLIDKELNNYSYLEKMITGNQIFLSENSDEMKKYNSTSSIYNELLEIKDENKYDEVIIIIFPFRTTKLWYKKQKEMLMWNNKPVRIIQVNNFER